MPVNPAPILVSVYTRLNAFRQCISALSRSPLSNRSHLYVVSDAPSRPEDEQAVHAVRGFAAGITGFRSVTLISRATNLGGFRSITSAEAEILAEHGRIIVLEDDVIASTGFLSFINRGLDALAHRKDVFSVCGYVPVGASAFAIPGVAMPARFHCPWGYGTWRDRYDGISASRNPYPEVVRDRSIVRLITRHCPFMLEVLREDYLRDRGCADVRISFQMLLAGMCAAYPPESLTKNIGLDGTGQRMKADSALMQQAVAETVDISDWRLNPHPPFENRVLSNGRLRPQRVISTLYRARLRDELDWMVRLVRRMRA